MAQPTDKEAAATVPTVPTMAVLGTVDPIAVPACGAGTVTGDAAPATANGTVEKTARHAPPKRRKNAELRPREYLTEAEIGKLLKQARQRGRYGLRDAAMILLAYRHGMRASELCALRWTHIDFAASRIDMVRSKRSTSLPHPLCGDELRLLRQVQRQQQERTPCAYVFMTERLGPMSPSGFGQMLARTGKAAGFGFRVHPHMLRHACGYKLANDGRDIRTIQDYLGHKNIQHTVRYTQLAADRLKELWKD
jgi:type 1 fimbriae regulatory protein FimB/type 1 fimbriae regulatory protein FimE